MSHKRALILFSCLLLFFSSGAAIVYADGKMVIKPVLSAGMSYDDNYFRDAVNERPVTIYYIKPGLEFGYTTAKSNLLFDYVLSANWYDEKNDPPPGRVSADEYDYIGHDMQLTADTQITDLLNIGLEDSYILTRDPASLDYYSNEITTHKYAKNIFNPKLFYQFGEKFGAGAGYANTNIDYKSGTDEDSMENRGAFNLNYHLSSLNALDLQYQIWMKDYDNYTSDYTSNQVMLTFSRELKYYTLTAGGGYQDRNFDDSTLKDIDGFVWNLAISGDRPQMLFALSQNINDTAVNGDYYLATRFTAEFGHLFLEKLNVKFRGYYQNSDYKDNPDNRKDDSWLVSLRIDYLRNKIFSIGLESGYETRDSTISVNDYDNSFVLLEIKFNYNLGSK